MLLMALLAAESADLAHGHPLDADLAERGLDLVKLERLEDGLDLLQSFLSRVIPRVSPFGYRETGLSDALSITMPL
jgi:hypothetical protein